MEALFTDDIFCNSFLNRFDVESPKSIGAAYHHYLVLIKTHFAVQDKVHFFIDHHRADDENNRSSKLENHQAVAQ